MTDLWAGEFGDDYTRRNMIDSRPYIRERIWESAIPHGCRSVLEVGANVGRNLEAIAMRHPHMELMACEPNDAAREELQFLVPRATADYADKLTFPAEAADLVITCGVLIHIPSEKLIQSMREIHRCARRWIICAEYFAPSEEMIEYRGRKNALWRRDYGSIWLDNFPDLHCNSTFFAWKRMTGMDNITFWTMEKGPHKH